MGLLSDWLRRKRSERQSAEPGPDPAQLEALRLRARHRLVGASVLVLIAVLLLPRVFDGTPRPLPSVGQAAVTVAASAASSQVPSPQTIGLPASSRPVMTGSGASSPAISNAPVFLSGPASTVPLRPLVSASASAPSTARPASVPVASATPASRTPSNSAAGGGAPGTRYFVQVGAFGNDHAAHEMRGRMERLGMKASEQEVNTASGRRIRVRLGPYGSRDEASAILAKVRASGVDAALMLQ